MAGLQQYQQQPMDFIDPNDPSLDDSNQDLMVRLFKQERNMRSLLLLLTVTFFCLKKADKVYLNKSLTFF